MNTFVSANLSEMEHIFVGNGFNWVVYQIEIYYKIGREFPLAAYSNTGDTTCQQTQLYVFMSSTLPITG